MLTIRLDIVGDELDLHKLRDVSGHASRNAFIHFIRKGTPLKDDPIYVAYTNRWRLEEHVESDCPIDGLRKARMLYHWLPDEMEKVWDIHTHISLSMEATGTHAYRAAKNIMEKPLDFQNELHDMAQLCDVDIHLSKPPEVGRIMVKRGQTPPVDAFMKFGDITYRNVF